jgi:hypothetical protein
MKKEPHLHERCREAMLGDEVFAEAYGLLEPGRRAWLKKLAAETHAMVSAEKRGRRVRREDWSAGFTGRVESRPVERTVLFIGQGVASPVQVAAAALPAVFRGTREFYAVRIGAGGDEPDDVLAALEICGIENVCALDDGRAAEMFSAAAADRDCALLSLGCEFQAPAGAGCAFSWSRPEIASMAVYDDGSGELDYQAIAWAHPNAEFRIFGDAGENAPEHFERLPGGLGALAGLEPEALFTAGVEPEVLDLRIPLVLGAGQEGCFFWPELMDADFSVRRFAVWDRGQDS